MMAMIVMTEKEKQIVRELGHGAYTVEFLEGWLNCNEDLSTNAPAVLTSVWAEGFYTAVKCMAEKGEAIPVFQKEDFLRTTVPYEYICNGKDHLEREQRKQMVSENAVRIGIKNFLRLFKSYVQSSNGSGSGLPKRTEP